MWLLYIAHERQLTTRCKIVWSGKRTEHFHCWLLSQQFLQINYTYKVHAHIHTHKIHTKAWMVGRLLSFIFCMCFMLYYCIAWMLCIHLLLSNVREKKLSKSRRVSETTHWLFCFLFLNFPRFKCSRIRNCLQICF